MAPPSAAVPTPWSATDNAENRSAQNAPARWEPPTANTSSATRSGRRQIRPVGRHKQQEARRQHDPAQRDADQDGRPRAAPWRQGGFELADARRLLGIEQRGLPPAIEGRFEFNSHGPSPHRLSVPRSPMPRLLPSRRADPAFRCRAWGWHPPDRCFRASESRASEDSVSERRCHTWAAVVSGLRIKQRQALAALIVGDADHHATLDRPGCRESTSSIFKCGTISPAILLKRASRSTMCRKPSASTQARSPVK